MKRFELAVDGTSFVGKSKSVYVDVIEYGDKKYASSDKLEFENKAMNLIKKMSGTSIGEIVDIIRNNGLDFDKILIDSSGITFDSLVQTFSKNLLLVSFDFQFDVQSVMVYPD